MNEQKSTIEPGYDLAGRVIGCAMEVHSVLGPGYLERLYANALARELGSAGIRFEREKPLRVFYKGDTIGDFAADLFIEGQLLVELKAVSQLTVAHEVQTVNYLAALGLESGLLLNFGAWKLEFKRKFRGKS